MFDLSVAVLRIVCVCESVRVYASKLKDIILTLIWGLHFATQFLGIVVNKDAVVQVEMELIDKTLTIELGVNRDKKIYL